MKTTAWILVVLGVLSLLVEASKGDSVTGPSFIIALGFFFFYRAHEKEDNKHEDNMK